MCRNVIVITDHSGQGKVGVKCTLDSVRMVYLNSMQSGQAHPLTGVFDDKAFQHLQSALKQGVNQQACAYWGRIRGQKRIPLKRDFDPAAVPRVLPSVILLDVLWPGPEFRYRLMGTRWVDHFDRDYTGQFMRAIEHQRPPSRIWDALSSVAECASPAAPDIPYVGSLFGNRSIEVFIAPLSNEGEQVDYLLATVEFNR